jgi:hypothetical protein
MGWGGRHRPVPIDNRGAKGRPSGKGRLDVLIHAEEIRGIVLRHHQRQPREVVAVTRLETPVGFVVHHEVDVVHQGQIARRGGRLRNVRLNRFITAVRADHGARALTPVLRPLEPIKSLD